MNSTNSITTKEKFKHLCDDSIVSIILQYNKFMNELNSKDKGIRKNKLPKRNINKTEFLKSLASQHNTTLSNIYNILKKAKTINLNTDLKEYVVYKFNQSKFNSIDVIINNYKLNRSDEIAKLVTVCTSTSYKYIKIGKIGIKPIDLPRMVRKKTNKDKTSKSVYMAFNKLAKLFSDNVNKVFKTITFDNDSEFARYKDIEKKHKLKIYFAHPYASYERGSNEKCNQLIRYYIPKGTNINDVPKKKINFIQEGINNKESKILNYKSLISFLKK